MIGIQRAPEIGVGPQLFALFAARYHFDASRLYGVSLRLPRQHFIMRGRVGGVETTNMAEITINGLAANKVSDPFQGGLTFAVNGDGALDTEFFRQLFDAGLYACADLSAIA